VASSPPSVAELQTRLREELARLGKDVSKTASQAPKGTGGAVFDLHGTVIDPDGPPDGQGGGELPPTGIQFTWTERLSGDYDMNGLVGLPDIVPIAAKWAMRPSYDSPALHGGFTSWPVGDPDDSSGGAAGPGGTNWRVARVDGDANGLIALPDITPIAAHWQESLSGYRVYRKGPGEGEFTMLPNPDDAASPLTIPREKCFPTGKDSADQARPVRYSFTDEPPVAGTYEYYVVACLTSETASPVEADTESNHVQVDFQANFPDVTPPTWDTTVGITAATANADGTIAVLFGTATDMAVPPAPASPPVSYTVYYSTQTPMDFEMASRVGSLDASPWISPVLLPGQTYYFAVRAQDSATPPNEESNTTELAATTPAGEPVVDDRPPVWTGTTAWGSPMEGFSEIRVGDGKLTITCADAVDVLSPPVHYDLYYLDPYDVGDGEYANMFSLDWPMPIVPEAKVIKDIPKVYDFVWPNRYPVMLLVRVRDSAGPSNEDYNQNSQWAAPGTLIKTVVDPAIPGYVNVDNLHDSSRKIADPKRHKVYAVYTVREEQQNLLRFIEFNADTAQWQVTQLYRDPDSQRVITPEDIAISWKDELWVVFDTGLVGQMSSVKRYVYRKALANGAWQEWLPARHYADYRLNFDHNGNPAVFSEEPSATTPGRYK